MLWLQLEFGPNTHVISYHVGEVNSREVLI